MRFRACIENVPTFCKIMQVIERLQKKCIIQFKPEIMRIICMSDANEAGIQVWSEIKVSTLFNDYRIQSNADNVISMSIASASLLHALQGIQNALAASGSSTGETARLALLSFALTTPSRTGRSQSLTYDVRIEVLRPLDMAKITEPLCPEPDTLILLPSLPTLRSPVERLRALSSTLLLRANIGPPTRLLLEVAGDDNEVRVKVEFSVKFVQTERQPDDEDGEPEEKDKEKLYTVPIAAKSFVKFLNCHIVSGQVIAAVCHRHCLILYFYIGSTGADSGGVLTFYIPSIVDDGPI
ncbi:cell cycle checkpoint [Gloeophyllum trabeum ATCC 11539]|uniref:Checkpoint protein n=1 Tax=Gloeophyllum trabeum (strain ATCC 11539 / FP-39264 / Madison 617) TaxID=670483 RepID=S7Q2Z4_GLOTA|nr:cell cycle checkpoint [Gloeophyllum trabeum ATCC 11539]EPQ53912.1 cell cycle checkpoint [Gloeophyllum trabeum ATCC 11539]